MHPRFLFWSFLCLVIGIQAASAQQLQNGVPATQLSAGTHPYIDIPEECANFYAGVTNAWSKAFNYPLLPPSPASTVMAAKRGAIPNIYKNGGFITYDADYTGDVDINAVGP